MSKRKHVKELERLAEPFGFTFDGVTNGGHLRFKGPGGVVFAAATPSCHRHNKNFVRDVKKVSAAARLQGLTAKTPK